VQTQCGRALRLVPGCAYPHCHPPNPADRGVASAQLEGPRYRPPSLKSTTLFGSRQAFRTVVSEPLTEVRHAARFIPVCNQPGLRRSCAAANNCSQDAGALRALYLQCRRTAEAHQSCLPRANRVAAAQLTRVDETHEQVAHMRTIAGLIEQSILAMQNRLLQALSTMLESNGAPAFRRNSVSFSQCLRI